MGYKRKTWLEKLADKENFPKILTLEKNFPCYNALHKMGVKEGDRVVLVNPSEVVEIMKKVPYGKVITINEICKIIAENHGVDGCCTLTTGIFITTAANASEEVTKEGINLGIPYWRTLKSGGYMNEKYPGGLEKHKDLLMNEGFQILKKGKKYFVKDFEKYLYHE
ncbi:MGMT family protein [Candidatus Bathyarchaeota archaeon]|nr:MGMT family protein [Candidatus Bathyarchaeota archaeon]